MSFAIKESTYQPASPHGLYRAFDSHLKTHWSLLNVQTDREDPDQTVSVYADLDFAINIWSKGPFVTVHIILLFA